MWRYLVVLRGGLSIVISVLCSALVWFAGLAITGLGFIVAGVYVLAGPGWSLVVTGVACLTMSAFIQQGLRRGR